MAIRKTARQMKSALEMLAYIFKAFFVLFAAGASSVFAQQGPSNLNITGVLYQSDGSPITTASVNFKLEIYDKTGSCLLFSETHLGQDLSNSRGGFALQIGEGSSINNAVDSSNPAIITSKVFENNGAIAGGWPGCPSGATLASGDNRVIRVKYDLGGGYVTMNPDVPIGAAAYSIVAETLQGKRPSDFIQVHDDVSNKLTQANVENVFSAINYPKLDALLQGTSTQYMSSAPGAAVDFNAQRIINVGTPTAASDAATKGYTDANIGGKAADVTGVGPATGDGYTLIWDQATQKWTTGLPSATDNTKLPLAGGTMTGTINFAAAIGTGINLNSNDLLGTGHITMSPLKTLTLGTFTTAQETTLVGTLTAANAGASWYNSTTNTFKIWDGSAAISQVSAGTTAGGDLTGTYPNPTIANDKVTSAKVDSAGIGINRLVISDQTTGASLKFATCATNEVLRYEGVNGWTCRDPSSIVTYPVDSVNGKTGTVVLNANDLGLGTAALENVGTAAGDIPQLDAGGKIPAGLIPAASAPTWGDIVNDAGKYMTYKPNNTACANNEILKFDGTNWICADISSLGSGDFMKDGSVAMTGNFNAGGNSVLGNTTASANLTLESTSNATKGFVNIQPNGGNVGIGTNAPTRLLDVNGPVRITPASLPSSPAAGDLAFDSGASNALKFYDGSAWQTVGTGTGSGDFKKDGSIAMTGDFDGGGHQVKNVSNVGIGTTAPSDPLHVRSTSSTGSSIAISTPGTVNGQQAMVNLVTKENGGAALGNSGVKGWQMWANGDATTPATDILGFSRYDGTTWYDTFKLYPSYSVGVIGGNSAAAISGSANRAMFGQNLVFDAEYNNYVTTSSSTGYSGIESVSGQLSFYTSDAATVNWSSIGASPPERMTIASTGNVGVGTNAPARLLHVNGAARFTPTTTPATPAAGDLFFDSAASNALKFYNGSAWQTVGTGTGSGDFMKDGSVAMTGNFNAGGNSVLGNTTASANLTLESTSNATKGFVNIQPNGGNVGVGVATPAYTMDIRTSSSVSQVHISGTGADDGAYLQASDANTTYFTGGTANNGSNWIAKATTASIIGNENGGFSFYSNSGLTIGNSFTPTQRMNLNNGILRLPAGGAVIIGDMGTPSGTLEVVETSTSSPRGIVSTQVGATTVGANFTGKRARGSLGSPASVADGDGLLGFVPSPYDGSAYLSTAHLGFIVNGTVSAGTVPTDFFINTGSTGTSGGTERLRITSAGRVGIGTSSPARLLDVNGAARFTPTTTPATPAAGDLFFDSAASNALKFYDGSAWKTVGIGTGSGDFMKDGSVAMTGNFNAGGNSILGNTTASANLTLESTSNATKGTVILQPNGGNVGIGTSTANSALDVRGVSGDVTSLGVMRFNSNNGTNDVGLKLGAIAGAGSIGYAFIQAMHTGAANDANLILNPSGSGNVGIGTTSPARLLDVNGAARFTPTTTPATPAAGDLFFDSAASNALKFYDGSAWQTVGMGNGDFKKDGSVAMTGNFNAGGNSILGNTSASADLKLESTSNATKGNVLIQANGGKVGIGTNSPGGTLSVNGDADVTGTLSSGYSNSSGTVQALNVSNYAAAAADSGASIYFTGDSGLSTMGTLAAAWDAASNSNGHLTFSTRTSSTVTEKVRIASTGNVGVGTNNPARLLHVNGAARLTPTTTPGTPAAGDLFFDSAASNAFKFYDGSAWQTVATGTSSGDFKKDGSVAMTGNFNAGGNSILGNTTASANLTLESTSNATKGYVLLQPNGGKVGIGTGTPGDKLHISETASFTGLRISNTGTNGRSYAIYSTGNGNIIGEGLLGFYDVATDKYRMVINSTGSVGIGTFNPLTTLHVQSSDTTMGGTIFENTDATATATFTTITSARRVSSAGSGVGTALSMNTANGTLAEYGYFGAIIESNTNGSQSGSIAFYPRKNDARTEALRITSSGSVGIGTTTPARLLDVNGTARLRPTTTPSTPAAGDLFFDSAASNALKFYNGSAWQTVATGTSSGDFKKDGSVAMTGNFNAGGNSILGNTTASANLILESTSNATKGTVLIQPNGGNVGIGTTSPGDLLTVRKDQNAITRFSITNGTNGVAAETQFMAYNNNGDYIAHGIFATGATGNSFSPGGSAYETTSSPWGLSISATNAAGVIRFGTGGATNERMRIDSSGNVGIGTTTPAEKLDVNGKVQATNFIVTSDAKFKKDVVPVPNALARLSAIRGVNYHWRQDEFPEKGFSSELQYGVIAQEIQPVFPDLVYSSGGSFKVNYQGLIAPLIESVKELNHKIETRTCSMSEEQARRLSDQVASNTRDIASLKAENEQLKRRLDAQQRQIEDLMKMMKAK